MEADTLELKLRIRQALCGPKDMTNFKKEIEDLNTLVSELRGQIDKLRERLESSEEQHYRDAERITQLEQQLAVEQGYYRPRIAED